MQLPKAALRQGRRHVSFSFRTRYSRPPPSGQAAKIAPQMYNIASLPARTGGRYD